MNITVFNFSTTGCAQCGLMDQRLNEVLSEYKEVTYKHIFVDKEPRFLSEYQLITSPTIVFLVDDSEVFRKSGIIDRSLIRKELDGIIWKQEMLKNQEKNHSINYTR